MGTESIERTLSPALEHFSECWYDSLFQDVLGANAAGMLIGITASKWLGMGSFDWFGRKGKNSISEWDIFHSHYKLSAIFGCFIIIVTQFLMSFMIPNALQYKVTDSYIGLPRAVFYSFVAIIGARQTHAYGNQKPSDTSGGIGPFCWILLIMVTLEVMILSKFYPNAVYPIKLEAVSVYWIWFWGSLFSSIILLYVYLKAFKEYESTEADIERPQAIKQIRQNCM